MELFRQTLTIMVLGMTLVFLFLLVVIQFMNLTAYLIRRWRAGRPDAPETVEAGAGRARLAAAIAAAIHSAPGRR
ncbi:MAG: hypothetical protein FJY88_03205 [Candidatus Eisenbacteria bacterium]|nr:hypothetical protein [Candidatus Eisenbacteria bacterium]